MPAAAERVLPALKPLCEQQFWLFGFDIRRGGDNLLLRWGFERQRQGGGGPTRYLHEDEDRTVALWGFGLLWIGAEHSAFLARHGRLYRSGVRAVPRVRDAWAAERRLRISGAGDPQLGADACAWIAEYERWVLETAGREHRVLALASREPCCNPEEIADAWEEHARTSRSDAARTRHPPGVFVD